MILRWASINRTHIYRTKATHTQPACKVDIVKSYQVKPEAGMETKIQERTCTSSSVIEVDINGFSSYVVLWNVLWRRHAADRRRQEDGPVPWR